MIYHAQQYLYWTKKSCIKNERGKIRRRPKITHDLFRWGEKTFFMAEKSCVCFLIRISLRDFTRRVFFLCFTNEGLLIIRENRKSLIVYL